MKKKTNITILFGIIIGAVLIALAIYFKPLPKNKTVSLDIKDREKGICSDMYAEGYQWGVNQVSLQVSIWREEGKSELLIKELLYDMLTN